MRPHTAALHSCFDSPRMNCRNRVGMSGGNPVRRTVSSGDQWRRTSAARFLTSVDSFLSFVAISVSLLSSRLTYEDKVLAGFLLFLSGGITLASSCRFLRRGGPCRFGSRRGRFAALLAAFSRRLLVRRSASAGTAGFFTAVIARVNGCPGATFGFLFGHTALAVALFNMLGLAFLLARIFGFIAARHFTSPIPRSVTAQTSFRRSRKRFNTSEPQPLSLAAFRAFRRAAPKELSEC